MTAPSHSPTAIARGRLRILTTVRWLGVAFGLVQVLAYRTMPYPDDVREVALGIVAAMAATNVVFEVARRRAVSPSQVQAVGVAMLVADVLVVSGLTWVYAFDSVSAIFAILFLLPVEGAVLFGLPGAMWTWGAVAALYVGREQFATRYGDPFEPESVTFRLGLIFMVALIVGMLVRDLVAQRQATALALGEAERLEESRTRLLQMLAHDVRAPIAGTRAALDTLRVVGERATAEQRAQIILSGTRQADRALLLVRDLLDLARVEAGTLSITTEPVDLAELLDRLELALAGRVEPEVDVAGLAVMADPARLEQVLFNLIDNAGKHGEPPVVVRARAAGEDVVLTVRDHGAGVPEDIELFTAFSHAGEGSVGLGMWIARHLVGAMGGTIGHEPARPGARFVIRLPRADAGGTVSAQDDASSSASGTTSPVSRS